MKKVFIMITAVLVSFSFMATTVTAKDKAAKKKLAPKVVKECKKDGTRCTPEEMKDKKMKKECKNPCPAEDNRDDSATPPAGQ